jgi:uroporphyrinogen-III synthase
VLLKDRYFIYTKSEGDSSVLNNIISENGGLLAHLPMIEIRFRQIDEEEQRLLHAVCQYNWIILTSSNAIKYLFQQLDYYGIDKSVLDNTKFAVVGQQTGKTLASYGYKYSYINSGQTGEQFAKELDELFDDNIKALYPTGNLTRYNMEKVLGDRVKRINVYNTLMPDIIDNDILTNIRSNKYDMLIFTSPSGFNNLITLLNGSTSLSDIRSVCIGTTTQQAMQKQGVEPLAVAKTANAKGIGQAILNYYESIKK